MPIYEYHCQTCDNDFEKMVRFTETEQKQACPHCGSQETKKQISAFAAPVAAGGTASSSSSCNSRGPFR